jgi:Zn-dependent alcohol dehydrogenase
MKTTAAVITDVGKDWEVTELDLDRPREGEVLVRFVAAGVCPTDRRARSSEATRGPGSWRRSAVVSPESNRVTT